MFYPAVLLFVLTSALPAVAEELKPLQARRIIIGKLWSFGCSEGTRGFGRIFDNGAVKGTIQEPGRGPVSHKLPPETVSMRPESICATVPVGSLNIRPCFAFSLTGSNTLRGRVSSPLWMKVLWGDRFCDFVSRGSN
jgi:hypothetical protein